MTFSGRGEVWSSQSSPAYGPFYNVDGSIGLRFTGRWGLLTMSRGLPPLGRFGFVGLVGLGDVGGSVSGRSSFANIRRKGPSVP